MKIRLTGIVSVLVIFVCVPAVSTFADDSRVTENWGKSFQAAKNAQIINPNAGCVKGPVEGFDGKAAQITMDAYRESFSKESERQGYTLDNIGVMVGGR